MENEMRQELPHQLQLHYDRYMQPKDAKDIDLIAVVRQMLVESGLLQRVLTAYDNDKFILQAHNKPSDIQRFLLNRFWSYQLIKSEVSSIEERTYLIPDGDITDWLRMFESKILPFAVTNNLPMA
jgi:hypothetical protein